MAKVLGKIEPEFPTEQNLALKRARKALLKLHKDIAKLHFEVAGEIETLKSAVPAEKLPGILVAECRVPSDLVQTYLELDTKLGANKDMLEANGVSVDVLKDLVSADDASRNVTLLRIASNTIVTRGQTKASTRDRRQSAKSPMERAMATRRRVLTRLAGRVNLRPQVESFELGVRQFTEDLNVLYDSPLVMKRTLSNYRNIAVSDPAYKLPHESLTARAKSLLSDFESLYGTEHPCPADWNRLAHRRPEAVRLGMAYESLRRFSEGSFIHGGFGFSFGTPGTTGRRLEMWEALQYLCAEKIALPGGASYIAFPKARLRAIELCAGIGGQALGLSQAGFEFETLFEKADYAAQALQLNRPAWNVSHADLSKDLEGTFRKYQGEIDLVSGGLPCQPYSGRGDGYGQFDERDLFPAAVKLIGIVQPKAFFFENVDGFTRTRHGSHRAEILQGFKDHGYVVHEHWVNAKNYGVAQDRKRLLIVGLRKEIAHRFHLAEKKNVVQATLGSTIAELLFPYRTDPDKRDASQSEKQQQYDRWSDWWLSQYGHKTAPTITKIGTSEEYMGSWISRGFGIGGIAERIPTPDDLENDTFAPNPTIAILKRLQGLPDDWLLKGEASTQMQQLANAFPPQAAEAIGLALRHAITGEQVDSIKRRPRPPGPLRLNAHAEHALGVYLEDDPAIAAPEFA